MTMGAGQNRLAPSEDLGIAGTGRMTMSKPLSRRATKLLKCIVPTIAFGIVALFAAYKNLSCDVYVPGIATTEVVRFRSGWPFPYLWGYMPGAASNLKVTPSGMWQHGDHSLIALAANVLIVVAVWPVTIWLCHLYALEQKSHARFDDFARGDRIQFCGGSFKGYTGEVDEVDIERGWLKISMDVSGSPVQLDAEPEEVRKL